VALEGNPKNLGEVLGPQKSSLTTWLKCVSHMWMVKCSSRSKMTYIFCDILHHYVTRMQREAEEWFSWFSSVMGNQF
jgi:hypothetical protein